MADVSISHKGGGPMSCLAVKQHGAELTSFDLGVMNSKTCGNGNLRVTHSKRPYVPVPQVLLSQQDDPISFGGRQALTSVHLGLLRGLRATAVWSGKAVEVKALRVEVWRFDLVIHFT